MSPSDPDKSRPKPPTLPWFDMLRYMWRGNLSLTARSVCFPVCLVVAGPLQDTSERPHNLDFCFPTPESW